MRKSEKLKVFFSSHKLTRRQAVLRNICIILVTILLLFSFEKNRIDEYSRIDALEEWTAKNFFGPAEICAEFLYADGEAANVYFSESTEQGKIYGAMLNMEKETPSKWFVTGSVTFQGPLVYDNTEETKLTKISEGVYDIEGLSPFSDAIYTGRISRVQNERGEWIITVNCKISFLHESEEKDGAELQFSVNLQTGKCYNIKCSAYQYTGDDGFYQDYNGGTFILSEKMMQNVAEITDRLVTEQDL